MIRAWFQINDLCFASSLAFLFLRLVVGLAFLFHGWGKIQNPFTWMGPDSNMPGVLQFLAAFSEFGGAIALILGFLTRFASFGIFCTMLVATYLHAIVRGDSFVGGRGQGSYELALVYLVISLLFLLSGAGTISLDRLIFGKRKKV